MIEPLDRSRRDSTLFQFITKQQRDFTNPTRVLIRIDKQLDFVNLIASLSEYYCPDLGRPAIHPEVMVRALLSDNTTTIGATFSTLLYRRPL